MKINQVSEAEEIVIELGERTGDIENLKRASNYVKGDLEAFLVSIARRAKYEFLLWKVVSKNHVGWLPKEVVYEGYGGWDTPYKIISTKPEGHVQITPETAVTCKLVE